MSRQSLMSRFLHIGAWAAFHAGARLTVRGRENIPPAGPVIVAVNHTHNMDPALIGVVMPWPVRFLAKRELVTEGNAITRWIVRTWGLIPITREGADRQALDVARRYLREGGAIGMFPEGTRSRDGRLGEARPGIAYMAASAGAAVLPVGIQGFAGMGHNPLRAVRRPRVTVRIGPSLAPPAPESSRDRESLARATADIMRAVAALLPEHMRGYYGDDSHRTQSAETRADRQ